MQARMGEQRTERQVDNLCEEFILKEGSETSGS